jgi:hypothetical protein
MTDFYPVLVRAVSQLGGNSAQERNDLYNHARKILVTQLRVLNPMALATEIMREQAALEAAIEQIEAGLRAGQRQSLAGPASHRPMTSRPLLAGQAQQVPTNYDVISQSLPNITTRTETGPRREPSEASYDGNVRRRGADRVEKPSGLEVFDEIVPQSRRPNARAEIDLNSSADQRKAISEIDFTHETKPQSRIRETSRTAGEKNIHERVSAARFNSSHRNVRTPKDARGQSLAGAEAHAISAHKKSVSFLVALVCVALIVLMIAFLVVIFVPLLVTHIPRLIWLSQHLFDNPTPLVILAGITGLLLILFLPIFHNRGRKSAIGLLWRSLTRTVPG